MKKIYLFLFSLFICNILAAQDQDYKIVRDISYTQSKNPYAVERCKLDLYYPENAKDFPTVVWFHGGGLSGGSKFIPKELKNCGLAVIAVNYRLLPKATLSDCIDDAAAAVAWTFSEIEKYGGDRRKIFVSGHSAVVLGIGRAIGETMAVLMVTGNAAVIPTSFFEPVRTIPATIAAELGEAPAGGAHYQALFMLGAVLFLITLGLSIAVEYISSKRKI